MRQPARKGVLLYRDLTFRNAELRSGQVCVVYLFVLRRLGLSYS